MPELRPIITLTSDFGMADGTVGAMIGVIKSICADAEVINLGADVPSHDVVRGAWALYQAAPLFPSGTIHVAVVDPGVGTERRGIAAFTHRATYIGPDNGILSWALRGDGEVEYRTIVNPVYRLASVGVTFDGRDLFAPAAAYLASGVDPEELGPTVDSPVEISWPDPKRSTGQIDGEVLVIDQFGNVISNIPFDWVAQEFGDAPTEVWLDHQPIGRLVGAYEEIDEGLGVVVNGVGLLEIAGYRQSAALSTGARRGMRIAVVAGANA